MTNNYRQQKQAAFVMLLLLGVSYVAFLLVLTSAVLPNLIDQLRLVWGLIQTNCSPQTILTSGGIYAGIGLGLIVVSLWAKVLLAGLRIVLSILRTSNYLAGLKVRFYADSVWELQTSDFQAFTAGLIKPQIYISRAMFAQLTYQELQSVISHETFHVISHDPLRKVVTDAVANLLPPFLYKHNLFHNYEVLCELSADEYAEIKVSTKRSIVSALNKIFTLADKSLNLNTFGAPQHRIDILVGNETFRTRQFFTIIMCAGIVFMLNTLFVSQSNILFNCESAFAVNWSSAEVKTNGAHSVEGICNFPEAGTQLKDGMASYASRD